MNICILKAIGVPVDPPTKSMLNEFEAEFGPFDGLMGDTKEEMELMKMVKGITPMKEEVRKYKRDELLRL
jgi:hypothetical protein